MSRMTYALPMMVSRVGLTLELHLLSLLSSGIDFMKTIIIHTEHR